MRISKYLSLLTLFVVAIFSSCEKEEALPGGTAPPPNTLTSTASDGSTVVLSQDDGEELFSDFAWTAVDYNGKTVKYSIELDRAGNNFMNAKDILTTEDLDATFTVEQINMALINFGIAPDETANVELRVRSWIDYIATPAVSNSFSFTLTPYLLTFPPVYVIGDAQAWSLDNAVTLTSNTPGVYTGTASFITGGKFRLFTSPDWASQQYGWSYFVGGSVPAALTDGQDGDSNFLFGGTAGDYIITVSLPTKSITLQPAGPPPPPSSIFIVTAQTLDLSTALELERDEAGAYTGIVTLTQNTKFRVFLSADWTAEKWAWGSFEVTDELLSNSGDDVANMLFAGETGYYIVTVSLEQKTISLEKTAAPQEQLFLIGDPQGWSLPNAWAMRSLGNNTFEVTGTFNTNQIFRFFAAPDWSADQYRWNSFSSASIDSELGDGGGGDSNFKFVATSGVYKITVSLSAGTVTVDPVSTPTLFIIGDDQSWNLSNGVSMTWLGAGKFQATTTFTNNSIFRFFETRAWDAVQWKYSSFVNGTVDSDLEDGGGSDSNFRFVGTTGSHTVTVDVNAKTITLE